MEARATHLHQKSRSRFTSPLPPSPPPLLSSLQFLHPRRLHQLWWWEWQEEGRREGREGKKKGGRRGEGGEGGEGGREGEVARGKEERGQVSRFDESSP